MNIAYNRGLDELRTWTTDTYQWILVQNAYTPDPDHDYIADLTSEVSVASYSRVAPVSPTRVVNDTTNQMVYDCADPDFGDLEDTQSARWLVLAKTVTNDADSPLICALDFGGTGQQLGLNFVVSLHVSGFAVARQVPA